MRLDVQKNKQKKENKYFLFGAFYLLPSAGRRKNEWATTYYCTTYSSIPEIPTQQEGMFKVIGDL